jgi:hypothetical protein
MELNCSRCHQTVQPGDCFCPVCGLPQLVFDAAESPAPGQPERGDEPVRDAGTIHWKIAIRQAIALAIPAGVLCSLFSPVGILCWLLMTTAGVCAVVLYVRRQHPAWITIGAGARIGLVTGIIGAWAAAATTALSLFAMRFWLHQGQAFDDMWQNLLTQQMEHQSSVMGNDAQAVALKTMFLSPEGRSGLVLCTVSFLMVFLLAFASAGGALGARLLARTRRPEL